MIIPYESEGGASPKNNNHQRNLTLASSYDEEADEIMIRAGWYYRQGYFKDADKQRKMAEDRYNHAKKLRNET